MIIYLLYQGLITLMLYSDCEGSYMLMRVMGFGFLLVFLVFFASYLLTRNKKHFIVQRYQY